jgi:hypothetical protein
MRYVKHLSVALVALGLSAPSLSNDTVYVPSQKGGFKLSVDSLYLRKNDISNLSDSSYDWGTYAQIGYLFPYTGNDLTLNYTYLRSGEKDSLDLDDAALEVGQRLTTGAFDVRLFSGLRYTHLNYNLNRSTSENTDTLRSLFHGFGPRIGLDARYQLGGCFGLDTHANTSLLIGTISTHEENMSKLTASSVHQVVPQLDAKLGVDYTYPIPGQGKSAIAVEVGYQTSNYFNTFNSASISSNANFDGAYVDVKYYS